MGAVKNILAQQIKASKLEVDMKRVLILSLYANHRQLETTEETSACILLKFPDLISFAVMMGLADILREKIMLQNVF